MASTEMTVEDPSEISWGEMLLEGKNFADDQAARAVRNVRSVGFISRPGQIEELKACVEGPLIDLLRQTAGFVGALILEAQKESRNLWVLTFWEAEDQLSNNRWEESQEACEILSPLIDVCTKVQTYQATLPRRSKQHARGKAASVS